MPYTSISDIPDYVKKYAKKRQRQWLKVFNSVYGRTGSEESAFKAANAILKQEAEMETIIQMRLDTLKDAIVQAGKRLSRATMDKLKSIMKAMEQLMEMDHEDEDMMEQTWAPFGDLLLQATITGESTADSYENQSRELNRALAKARLVPGDYPYIVYTWPDHIVFCSSSWDGGSYNSKSYRVEYTRDDDGITFGEPEEWSLQEVGVAVQSALLQVDEFLTQQAKRKDVSAADKARAAKEYGDVTYADPTNKKYPLDTEKHVRAAWSYINMPKNAAKYSADDLAKMKSRIKRAAKALGIKITEDAKQSATPIGGLLDQGDGKPPFLVQVLPGSITFVQADKATGKVAFGGVATHGNVPNDLDPPWIYPTELWEGQMATVGDLIEQGKMVGSLDHNMDAKGRVLLPSPDQLSHKFTQIQMSGDLMEFEAETLSTSQGKELAALLQDDVALEMSTVATGKVKKGKWDGQSAYIVQDEDFQLHFIDVVLRGASPGSAITDVWLQSLDADAGPRKEKQTMDPDEIKQLIAQSVQQLIADGNKGVAEQLQALETKIEGLGPGGLSDDEKALIQTFTNKLQDEERIRLRGQKIEEIVAKMVEDKHLPMQFSQSAKQHFAEICRTAEEVEQKKDRVLDLMKPFLAQQALMQSKGFYVPEYGGDGLPLEGPQTPAAAIEELVQTGMERKILHGGEGVMFPGMKERRDFSDTGWVMRQMLETLAVEKPFLVRAYIAKRNGLLPDIESARSFLETNVLAPMLQSGQLRQGPLSLSGAMVQAGEMTTTDLAAAVPFVFPLVLEVWPQLIAWQLGTVQPLQRSSGRIYYWKIYDQDNKLLSNVSNFTGSYANDPGEKTQVKHIKGKITSADVATEVKKLGYDISVEVMRHLRTDFGMDASPTLLQAVADEIAREWNFQILADMFDGATAGNVTYGTSIPAGGSFDGEQWQKQFPNFVERARDLIFEARYTDTVWIIGDARAITDLTKLAKSVGDYSGEGAGRIAEGVDIVGTVNGREKLVKVAWLNVLRANKLLVGAKGPNWPRTGYVIAPYLGLFVTPVWIDPETQDVVQSTQSELARKMVDGNYFATVTISRGVAGTPLT